MKNLILGLSLALSSVAFAADVKIEFDKDEEISCHSEYKDLGCVNGSDEEVVECIQTNTENLSKTCKSLYLAKTQKL